MYASFYRYLKHRNSTGSELIGDFYINAFGNPLLVMKDSACGSLNVLCYLGCWDDPVVVL